MAKKVSASNVHSIYGAKYKQAVASTLLNGIFVGLDANGELVPADHRNSESKPAARGALMQDAQRKDFFGNVIATEVMGSYCREGKIAGLTGLTPGASYYLTSGGGIQLTKPGTTGDLAQYVGYAESSTVLVIAIGDPVVQ